MKTVLITGSSRGIGKAIARRLNPNYKIAINYKESKKAALSLLEELRQTNPYTIAIGADVSKEDQVEEMFATIEKNLGAVDILINNAGIAHYSLIQDTPYESFQKIIQTNLDSVFLTSKRAVGKMLEKKEGVIINISSIWGEEGSSMESAYSASKGAINSLTKSLAKELAPSKIRVNAIAPGIVETDMMTKDFSKEELEELKKEVGMERFAKADEIANLVAYLISEEASYITGDIININGGY
ncbi:elongation factor P 5-aminopentanone reductase [Anaerococcus tetradius]|uniref:elongation factor P 5-aminopentanone reductase n=1 Tax=Anaerococcus tetradius TaxID=33036 RepID=UPI0023F3F408|nr:3-oxoacyl-ACP reductase FabG [Anaerococcus tetradius]